MRDGHYAQLLHLLPTNLSKITVTLNRVKQLPQTKLGMQILSESFSLFFFLLKFRFSNLKFNFFLAKTILKIYLYDYLTEDIFRFYFCVFRFSQVANLILSQIVEVVGTQLLALLNISNLTWKLCNNEMS